MITLILFEFTHVVIIYFYDAFNVLIKDRNIPFLQALKRVPISKYDGMCTYAVNEHRD